MALGFIHYGFMKMENFWYEVLRKCFKTFGRHDENGDISEMAINLFLFRQKRVIPGSLRYRTIIFWDKAISLFSVWDMECFGCWLSYTYPKLILF
jgi:hypothetical protein